MSIYEREDKYIKLLSEKEHTVSELAERLFISEPTVHRDLNTLTKRGLITRVRGRVKLNTTAPDQRIPLFLREQDYSERKRLIARKAVGHIRDGYTIMLDASTSAYHMLSLLTEFKGLFVITSGAKTAIAMAAYGIRCFCTGGFLTPESLSYIGADAERTLGNYNADVAFFSCHGIAKSGIITDNSIEENNIRRIMMKNASKSYLLCDSSKFDRVCLNTLCTKNELTGIITDQAYEFDAHRETAGRGF